MPFQATPPANKQTKNKKPQPQNCNNLSHKPVGPIQGTGVSKWIWEGLGAQWKSMCLALDSVPSIGGKEAGRERQEERTSPWFPCSAKASPAYTVPEGMQAN